MTKSGAEKSKRTVAGVIKARKKPKTATQNIHINPKHAKPYRKRHLGLLAISLILFLVLLTAAVRHNTRLNDGLRSARNYITGLFSGDNNNKQVVESTYGFSLEYEPQKFYASAIDGLSGNLFLGQELSVKRAYQTVRIAPN